MKPLMCLLLAFGVTGCLDFAPGTPNPNTQQGGMPDMAKPSSPTPSGSHDMAMGSNPSNPPQPGADMAMGPPAPLGMQLCEATLSLSGSYVQGSAPPTAFPGGCWPDGMWTFTATITNNSCTSAPPLETQYQFKIVEDLDYNDTITYVNDPTNMYVATKISGGEGGVCVGAFTIYSADGKTVYNLRPAMQADNSINGAGDIRLYDADQRN